MQDLYLEVYSVLWWCCAWYAVSWLFALPLFCPVNLCCALLWHCIETNTHTHKCSTVSGSDVLFFVYMTITFLQICCYLHLLFWMFQRSCAGGSCTEYKHCLIYNIFVSVNVASKLRNGYGLTGGLVNKGTIISLHKWDYVYRINFIPVVSALKAALTILINKHFQD